MTSSNTLLKKIIGVKDVVATDAEIYSDHDGVTHLTIDARPNSWNRNKCPFCGRKKLPGYDRPSQSLRRYLISELIKYPRENIPYDELEKFMPWSDTLPEICHNKK